MTQAATAKEKLELSSLNVSQLEGLSADIDLSELRLFLNSKSDDDLREAVLTADVERTIDAASTLTVEVLDRDRKIANSGKLIENTDIKIDGLWFRLRQIRKTADRLYLVFEDREVSIMRLYDSKIVVAKNTMTREQFAVRLIKEVKEFKIPYEIPTLTGVKKKPIESSDDRYLQMVDPGDAASGSSPGDTKRDPGFGPSTSFKIKSQTATWEQKQNITRVLNVGISMGARRKVLVTAIMTIIQESSCRNLDYPEPGAFNYLSRNPLNNPVGIFQQRRTMGWPATRDIEKDAAGFYKAALAQDALTPFMEYYLLAEEVQRSGNAAAYAQWRTQAERVVTLFGVPGGANSTMSDVAATNNMNESMWSPDGGGRNQWSRGWEVNQGGRKRWKHEDTWECLGRLASEIDMRRFMVSGRLYFIDDEHLFKSRVRATINEDSDGVNYVDYDYTKAKNRALSQKSAEVTISCRVNRWLAPPGSLVEITNAGPATGRYLVHTIKRSLFSADCRITCRKPRPRLPEPIEDASPWATPGTGTGTARTAPGGSVTLPLPTALPTASGFSYPDAEGAPDRFGTRRHAGLDWFAPGGTSVFSPVDGTIIQVTTTTDSSGQVYGGVVKIKDSSTGEVWVFRHVSPVGAFREGATVSAGTQIATVTTWSDNPSSSHAHIELWKTENGGYNYENMIDPLARFNGRG